VRCDFFLYYGLRCAGPGQVFYNGFDSFFQLIGITFAQTGHAIEKVFRVVAVKPVGRGYIVKQPEITLAFLNRWQRPLYP